MIIAVPLEVASGERRVALAPDAVRRLAEKGLEVHVQTGAGTEDGEELEGVFVIRDREAFFQPVATGISGITDIEVLSGLQEGDEIVTGSYEALRTLQSGARVRIDNDNHDTNIN